jgi:hypothetical protein
VVVGVTVGRVADGEAELEVFGSRSKPGRVGKVVGARRTLPVVRGYGGSKRTKCAAVEHTAQEGFRE